MVFKSSTFLEAAQAFGGAPARAASPADRRYEASRRGPGHHRNGLSAVQLKEWGSVIEIMFHWIGLRENLQETMVLPSNIGLSCKFSHNPIL